MLRIIIVLSLLLIGCSSPRYYTKAEEMKIVPETIEKELKATTILDTVIIAKEVQHKDTITIVKYYPVEKKFYLKAKPDTIKLTKIDTLVKIEEKVEKNTDYSLVVIAFLLGLIIPLFWRKK